jgi:hypothetical protein
MKRLNLTITVLNEENEPYDESGIFGTHRDPGFRPAFFDCATCTTYLSRYRDGRAAPLHLLDGLPDEVVLLRAEDGRVVMTKPTLFAGFERNGFFYTRASTARALAEWSHPLPALLPPSDTSEPARSRR